MGFYDWLATEVLVGRMPFLNYGYVDPGGAADPDQIHDALLRQVLAGVPLRGSRVLEVGCGHGGNCGWIAEEGAATVIGLDPCLPGLERTSRRAWFVGGEAASLPSADASLDVVLSVEASHAYPDLSRFIAEAARVLRRGGMLCWADLWGVEALGLDWQTREEAFCHPAFEPVAERDLSEGVFRALRHPRGLPAMLSEAAREDTRTILDSVVHNLEVFRLHLAAGEADYRMRQLRRR